MLAATLAKAGRSNTCWRALKQDVKDRLAANTKRAYEKGAFGIPSSLVNDELYFGKDRLRHVEELARTRRARKHLA